MSQKIMLRSMDVEGLFMVESCDKVMNFRTHHFSRYELN